MDGVTVDEFVGYDRAGGGPGDSRRRVGEGDESGRVDEGAHLPGVECEETVEDDGGAGSVPDEDGGSFALDLLLEDLGEKDACFLCLVLRRDRMSVGRDS